MDGTREYNAKWNKSVTKKQIPYDHTYMGNLRNKTNEQKQKRQRQTKKQTLNYREQTNWWLAEGEGMGEIGYGD